METSMITQKQSIKDVKRKYVLFVKNMENFGRLLIIMLIANMDVQNVLITLR